MSKHWHSQYKWLRRLAILMAAAPLFQFAQCATGVRQVGASMANSLPATLFAAVQQALLAPLYLLVGGGGSTGTGM